MPPINFILLFAPWSTTTTEIHLLHEKISHFINMLVLFIHHHINENAFWGVRLLSHHLTDTQPQVTASLSTFIRDVHRILLASISNERYKLDTLSFDSILNQLISTAISLASTATPSATCPSTGLAVSPVRSNREKLTSSVSVKTVILVFAPLPSTPNECRSFFKSFINQAHDYNCMHFNQCIHTTLTCLAKSNLTAPLLTSGAIVHWVSLTSLSPLVLADRFGLTNFIAMLGGICISLHDVDFSLPLRLLFAGIAPNDVCAPGTPVPWNTPQPATFNIYTSDTSLFPIPVISLHPGPFPVGPWSLNGWCYPHDYYAINQPNCLNIIHSLIVPLDTLTKDIALPLSQSNLVLFMKAKNCQSQPEFHYSFVCLLSAQYAIVHILGDLPDNECLVVRHLPIPIENQCDSSTDLIVLTSACLPYFDMLQSSLVVEPECALPVDSHGMLDIDDLMLIPKSGHHTLPISDSNKQVVCPSTPRRPRLSKLQPATPLRRKLGITSPLHTPGKPNNLTPELTNLLACNTSSLDIAQLNKTVLDWYWALVYSHSTCLFVNLIDPILQIRNLFTSLTHHDLFTMLLLTPDKVLAKFIHIKAGISSTQRAAPGGSCTQIHSKTSSRLRIDLPLPQAYNNPFDPPNSETTKFNTRGLFEPEMNFIQSQIIALGNTNTWLREYKLREIIVQVIFHFEFLVVNKCDTSPSACATSSIDIDTIQQQARTAILKLLLRLDHIHRRSDALTEKTTAHATKSDTKRKTCDPSIQSWLEKCILYNYFYHFPDFVTEIYESHGGNVHAYTQATSNAFSPLTRTDIEPLSNMPVSAPLNSGRHRLLDNINGREIIFPNRVAQPISNPSRKQSTLCCADRTKLQDSGVSITEPNLLKDNNNLVNTQRTFFTVDNSPTIASRKQRDINSEKWFAKKLGGQSPSPTRSYSDFLPSIDPDFLCKVPPELGTGVDNETCSYESLSSSPCKGRELSSLAHAYARYNKAHMTEHQPVTVQGKVGLKSILSRFRSLKRSASSGGNVLGGSNVLSENMCPASQSPSVDNGPKTPSPPRQPVLPQTPGKHNESLLSGGHLPD